jgi:hypothetical protein
MINIDKKANLSTSINTEKTVLNGLEFVERHGVDNGTVVDSLTLLKCLGRHVAEKIDFFIE